MEWLEVVHDEDVWSEVGAGHTHVDTGSRGADIQLDEPDRDIGNTGWKFCDNAARVLSTLHLDLDGASWGDVGRAQTCSVRSQDALELGCDDAKLPLVVWDGHDGADSDVDIVTACDLHGGLSRADVVDSWHSHDVSYKLMAQEPEKEKIKKT